MGRGVHRTARGATGIPAHEHRRGQVVEEGTGEPPVWIVQFSRRLCCPTPEPGRDRRALQPGEVDTLGAGERLDHTVHSDPDGQATVRPHLDHAIDKVGVATRGMNLETPVETIRTSNVDVGRPPT
ncbi:MAG: hypothetical protein U5L08_14740 [Xanthomonadales bacterium]|nr:hypothetical protein [Xanthomonadales bacterium]